MTDTPKRESTLCPERRQTKQGEDLCILMRGHEGLHQWAPASDAQPTLNPGYTDMWGRHHD